MKNIGLLLVLMTVLSGCGQDYNSNSGDEGQYAPITGIDSSTPDGERLLASYKIFQAKCFSCHSAYSSYKTSAQWVSANLVTPGNLSSSPLYNSLKNVGGNMPKDPVPMLTPTELAAVESWISQM